MISKPLFRGYLSVTGISKPIKLWWTAARIQQWHKKEEENLATDFIRIKTTPYSMVEFLAKDFLGIEFTDERCGSESIIVRESTLLYNYYRENRIPIPLETMHSEYTYPSVLLGFNRIADKDVCFFDYTGYFNFRFLREDKMDIEEYLCRKTLFSHERFMMEDFTIAEYSVPPRFELQ